MDARRRYSGVVLVLDDGQVLLQRRDSAPGIVNPGRVSLFGGLAEDAESPRACAIRELREELELVVDSHGLTSLGTTVKEEQDGTSTECALFVFHVPRNTEIVQHEGAGVYIAMAEDVLADTAVSTVTRLAVRLILQTVGKQQQSSR